MSINCYLCGIIIGEDHLETACYRYRSGYICTDCNETFLVKNRKLTLNEWSKISPVRYIPIAEIPPFAYHIPDADRRHAIRLLMLRNHWYVYEVVNFLISWIPVDKYEELLLKLEKGKANATVKGTV
jgi:hypothetical protein